METCRLGNSKPSTLLLYAIRSLTTTIPHIRTSFSVLKSQPTKPFYPATPIYMEREIDEDPLWKNLWEKKQSFRKNVVSLASDLKDARIRLATHEQSFESETLSRQYLKDLEDLRSNISTTQATADASSASAQSAQFQCLALLDELDEKNSSLREQEACVNRLKEQLNFLQKDFQTRDLSQKQLKDEVREIEHNMMQVVSKSVESNDFELKRPLDEFFTEKFRNLNEILREKDEEIAKLRDETRIMSTHWKVKTEELESQLELHRKADQELKKRVLKLEFCVHDARSQTRKLQRMGENRDNVLKELEDQLAMGKKTEAADEEKHSFWETSGFKIVVSMSMLILVLFSRR